MSTSTTKPPTKAPDEQAVADDPAALAEQRGLPRPSNLDEDMYDYVTEVARFRGAVAQDAQLDADAKRRLVDELLERARSDELRGGSPVGDALLAAADLWRLQNPSIQDVGELTGRDRDGASIRGLPLVRALLLAELARDVSKAERLTLTERALIGGWQATAKLEQAVADLESERERHLELIAAAVEQAQREYRLPKPPPQGPA